MMTGNYEFAVTTIVARFAGGCDAHRLEALAMISENPAAARDLGLIQNILCGVQLGGSTVLRDARAIRRVPRFVEGEYENYDLIDIQHYRDTGVRPVRFRLPNSINRIWPEHLPAGSAIVVDLDTSDANVQRTLLQIMQTVNSLDMGLLSLLWEHGRHGSDIDGRLSTGYIEAALNRASVRSDRSCRFNDLTILDVFPYCTSVFAHYVDAAQERYATDTPLLALAKALDLDAFAASKHCMLHGIVDITRAIELLKDQYSDSSPTSAAIVHCKDAHGKPHHFALIWTRAYMA